MRGKSALDVQLNRLFGLTMKELEPILAVGGDAAETKFMECCWRLWKADGIELVGPFIEAAFNIMPARSRSVLFERMLTIVYVAQDSELHAAQSGNETKAAPT
jgi:hypothetical protein